MVPLAVNVGDVATPDAFVVTATRPTPPVKVPVAPKPGAAKVTLTPATGLPPASLTVATKGAAKAVLTAALCPPPLVAVIEAGGAPLFVSEKLAGVVTPATLAFTLYGPPAVPLAVKTGDVAIPDALVVAVAVFPPPVNVPLAPLPGAVNVTVTPPTGLPPVSFTVATRGAAKAVFVVADWPLPLVAVIDAGEPPLLVSEKLAGTKTPEAAALTVYAPVVLFAVKTGDVATPEAFVIAVALVPLPEKLPLAPKSGAANVTDTPLTGFPPASLTVATSGAANAVPTAVPCPLPLVAVMEAAPPAELVSEKLAFRLPTEAVTLYEPAVPFALNGGDVATPDALVVTVAVVPPPKNVPLAPLPGAVNVTLAPLTGFPPLSFTRAVSGRANAVLTVALCPLPPVAVIDAAVPAVTVTFVEPDVKPVAVATMTGEPGATPVT